MNISKAQFALLPPLYALLKHQNITHAAEHINISQSAMSKIFVQLKASFNDELLIRTGKHYNLTQRGENLLQQLEKLMPQAECLWQAPALDLANEKRFIDIAGTDMDIDYLSPKLEHIINQAPKAGISVTTSDEQSLNKLTKGEIDFVMTAFDQSREPLERALVIESHYVVLSNHHLTAESMDLAHYLQLPHVAFQLSGARKSAVDMLLSQQGLARKISLWTPTFYHGIKTIATSTQSYLLTMPQLFVEQTPYAKQLKQYPLPLTLKPIKVYLYWHKKINNDPFLNWAKDILLR